MEKLQRETQSSPAVAQAGELAVEEMGVPCTQRSELLRESVSLYQDLIFFENYAVMNYVGFEKILKKHDKLTGHDTKEKYMVKMVSKLPFAGHLELLTLIQVGPDLES